MKYLKALLSALVLSVLFAVPVMAASMNFYFNVDIADDADAVQYSNNTLKTDDDSYARVTYSNSNITSNDDFQFYVVGQNGNNTMYSYPVQANAAQATYYMNYKRTVYNGNYYRLAGQTYAYYVSVSGDWAP